MCFFFQAEDGIRDIGVTGVQTCALPIFEETLKCEPQVKRVARDYMHARDFLFLGRGPMHPVALEGALKLKEISYIHAEGSAGGEMKHGPIALIDENMQIGRAHV